MGIIRNRSSDWPLELRLSTGKVERGLQFHGTKRQLNRYLVEMNSVSTGGVFDVDRSLLPDEKIRL